MKSGLLQVEVEGLESLETEFETEFMPRVNKAVTAGLNAVASDLTASLQRHIQTEVYDAYEPTDYKRRYGNGLLDEEAINWSVKGSILNFEYNPTASPSEWATKRGTWREWDDGDTMIAGIQEDIYPTVGSIGVKRPFWDNFINEELRDGKAEVAFTVGVNMYDSDLAAKAGKEVIVETNDGELNGTGAMSKHYDYETHDTELPF